MSLLTSQKKLQISEIEKELESQGYQMVANSYDPKSYKIDCVCPNNHITRVRYHSWKKNINKCTLCPKKVPIIQKNITIEKLRDIFKDAGCTLLSTEYNGYDEPLNYICPIGHNTRMSFHVWKNNKYKCRECAKEGSREKLGLSFEFVKNEFEKRGYKLLSTEYKNKISKLSFECNEGHQGSMSFDSFYYANNICIECTGSKKHTIDEIREAFNKEEYILLSTEYKNNHTKLEYKCPKGHIGEMNYNNFSLGKRCGTCCNSKGESAVAKHLTKLNLKFIQEKKFDDCKNIKLLLFDFYIDNKFIIEFDGQQHFESTKFFGGEDSHIKRQHLDKIKTDYCIKKKMPLLRISYDEIENIPKHIDDFIELLKTDSNAIHFTNDKLYEYLN